MSADDSADDSANEEPSGPDDLPGLLRHPDEEQFNESAEPSEEAGTPMLPDQGSGGF